MKLNVAVMILTVLLSAAGVLLAASAGRNDVMMMEIEDEHETERTLRSRSLPSLWTPQDTGPNILVNRDNSNPESVPSAAEESESGNFDVVVNVDSYVNNVGSMFVGVTLDSSVFRRMWKTFNVSSKQLQSLAKGIAPSFLRVGGTAADFFIFNATGVAPESAVQDDDYEYDYDYDDDDDFDKPQTNNYTVTGKEWKQLNGFVREVGWHLIFDFNEFLRKGDVWNPDNARKLLTFSQERNFSIPIFQLGNEPNAYYHNFNFSIPGSRLARDMQQLRALLSEFPAYRSSYIIGPDVTKVTKESGRNYLEEFLKTGGQNVVSAVTLHHYYFNAKTGGVSVKDFVNITILNSLIQELYIGNSIANALAPKLPVWFSETSSVSGGGLRGVSDGYAAGFMWLDKLGLSAMSGLKAVIRQSFYNGNYALISHDFTPYPDYFLTVLYKRLVQGPVFLVTSTTDAVRMYASCANPSTYQKGALTVYILNVRHKASTLNFTQFTGHQYELYLLTPGDEHGLRSSFVALNGQKLVMVNEELPPLPPLLCSGKITFPAHSFGFVVIPQAGVKLCM